MKEESILELKNIDWEDFLMTSTFYFELKSKDEKLLDIDIICKYDLPQYILKRLDIAMEINDFIESEISKIIENYKKELLRKVNEYLSSNNMNIKTPGSTFEIQRIFQEIIYDNINNIKNMINEKINKLVPKKNISRPNIKNIM